ncbi:unnamed protein product [Polarella glacialis]|uniref:Cytochrome b561 domain-containing protein n=1 Tax=Polarella glacialis TaxID=89957 RepID=A0A813KAM0_POLGL|nr:unnamed protein product [Polarella glacialis]
MHRAFMGSAAIVMLLGYLAIFMAHLPNRMFFGYDFKKQEWKPMIKVAHSWVGYALLVGVLAQGYMGAMKLKLLKATGFGSRLRAIMGTQSVGVLGIVLLYRCFMESYTILGNVMWLWLCVDKKYMH